jgi:hypothetical protein
VEAGIEKDHGTPGASKQQEPAVEVVFLHDATAVVEQPELSALFSKTVNGPKDDENGVANDTASRLARTVKANMASGYRASVTRDHSYMGR